MSALRDALAVALILDRRPVLMVTPELPPLNGANISSALDMFGVQVYHETAQARRSLQPPPQTNYVFSSINDLRAALQQPSRVGPIAYSRVLFSFSGDSWTKLQTLARQHQGRRAWAELFLSEAPDCWAAAFLRPARRVRAAVLPLVRDTAASVHLRVCNLINWDDTCVPVEHPYAAARSVLRCTLDAALAAPGASTLFVASDSGALVQGLRRDASSKNLSLETRQITPSAVSIRSVSGLGTTAHLSRMPSQHEVDAQTSFDRAVFDWAAYAYSPQRVVALPSSFPASAVCMFAPGHIGFVVLRLPVNGEVSCTDPLSSSLPGSGTLHPCRELHRVNAKVLKQRSMKRLPPPTHLRWSRRKP